ncbi:MAG: hemerythrin family protein [Alphaproteobacteria bacterium]|nr:hemerythrin family protein [Alphaproteobacteria bacterium]
MGSNDSRAGTMSFINWSDFYRVGVAEIDADHERLAGMINRIHDELYGGANDDRQQRLFAMLSEATRHHFAREESFFDSTHYPAAEHHRRLHADLKQRLDAFQANRRKASDPTVLLAAELAFLRFWLLDHIVKEDKELGAHLNSCGIR